MTALRLAYLAFAGGLLGFGAISVGLGLRRHVGPTALPLRLATILTLVVAAAGLVAAVMLEARAANPW